MQFAQLNGVTLHYQLIGAPPEKPVLVFVNSLGCDFRIWRDVIVRLVGEFALIAYDKRGHGLSDVGPLPYTMDNHADDLAALLDHLGQSKVIVCGVSVGGMIAQTLASRRPDLVSALVLCDTGHKIGTDEIWNERISMVEADGLEALGQATMERWFTEAFRKDESDAVAGYYNMLVRQPAAGYAATAAAIRDTDLTDISSTLAVPVSCVVGDSDLATPPELVGEMAKLIPGARYDIIKNAGHLPSIEQPAVLADIISAFAAGLSEN